jgi:hypothetical protein
MATRIASDIVIVPIFNPASLPRVRGAFDDAVRTFPEFHHPPAGSEIKYPYVPGSFGAFRNPANFHCQFARDIRSVVHGPAMAAIGEQGKYFTELFDSMAMRAAGMQFNGESWHRDSNSMPGKIWGGWVNLDSLPQHFQCVPDSAMQTGQGFGKEQVPPEHLQRTIDVQPGCMILFRQDILHCILKSKKGFDSYRQYVGFRVSDSPDQIYDASVIIAEQKTPLLPSGEKPAMYSKNHASALLYSHTIPWSVCIVQDWVTGGELLCPRHITWGLVEKGKAYAPYEHDDIAIMMPRML